MSGQSQLQPLVAPREHLPKARASNNPSRSQGYSKSMKGDTVTQLSSLDSAPAFIVAAVLVVLLTVFHKDLVGSLTPVSKWTREQPAGFLIPIACLIVLSVPPLVGAEIIHVTCGAIYGVWKGFLVVCVGTIIGETLTFFLFRYWLHSRAEEMGRRSPQWASLSRIIRDNGFWLTLIIRYSAVPTHISTGLFAANGMMLVVFFSTLILSLPRQLAGVALGALAAASAPGNASRTDKIVSNSIMIVVVITTLFALYWSNRLMSATARAIAREPRAREETQFSEKQVFVSNVIPHGSIGSAEPGKDRGLQEMSEADAREYRDFLQWL